LHSNPARAGDKVADLQRMLARYGYGIEASGDYDEATAIVVSVFQRHFRPARVDGIADASTLDTLRRCQRRRPRLLDLIAQSA